MFEDVSLIELDAFFWDKLATISSLFVQNWQKIPQKTCRCNCKKMWFCKKKKKRFLVSEYQFKNTNHSLFVQLIETCVIFLLSDKHYFAISIKCV